MCDLRRYRTISSSVMDFNRASNWTYISLSIYFYLFNTFILRRKYNLFLNGFEMVMLTYRYVFYDVPPDCFGVSFRTNNRHI